MGGSRKSQATVESAPKAFSITGVRMIVASAAARGLDTQELLASIGLPDSALAEPESWVSEAIEWRLWDEAARRLHDPVFGLHVGESMVASECPEILYHAARVCPTVGECLRRLVRFFSVFHRRTRVRLEVDGELARFTKDGGARVVPCAHGSLAVLGNVLLRLRGLLPVPFPLREVWFTHPRPANIDEYARIFAAPVRFSQPCNALICDRAQLDWPLPTRSPGLLDLLDRHLAQLAGPPADDFLDQVKSELVGHLHDAGLNVTHTARRLGMSQRTLQRRLQDAGRGFQELLDDARRELALRHLAEGRLTICEVSYRLGFTDLRGFYRAFKRWTGSAPGQHRPRSRAVA